MKRFFTSLIAQQDHSAYLMGRMANHLGVDLAAVGQCQLGTRLIRMAGTCRACPNTRQCQRFLEAGDAGLSHHEFCPNARAFEEFRA